MKPHIVKGLAHAAENALEEAMGAANKFPSNRHMHAALVEEVGELAQALLEHSRGSGVSTGDVYAEAMQVAAMALRIAVEGSEEFAYVYDEANARSFRPTGAPKTGSNDPKAKTTSADWLRELAEAGVIAPAPHGTARLVHKEAQGVVFVSQNGGRTHVDEKTDAAQASAAEAALAAALAARPHAIDRLRSVNIAQEIVGVTEEGATLHPERPRYVEPGKQSAAQAVLDSAGPSAFYRDFGPDPMFMQDGWFTPLGDGC